MDADELAIKRREFKLDIWKVIISALTPIAIGALTFVVNSAVQERGELLKREEQILSEKQKVYGDLGKRLNIIYVYLADVGDFKLYTPERVIEMKRESDRQFFVYRPYWSETTEQRYNDYMKAAFTTYNGVGLPARINASKGEKIAAYEQDGLKWDAKWDPYFTERVDPFIERKYYSLVSSILADTVNATVRKLQ